MASFLICYASGQGQTAKVADYVRTVLTERGHDPTLRHVSDTTGVDIDAFDAVLVGSPVNYRKHLPAVVEFVDANRDALTSRPTAFFQLSFASILPSGQGTEEAAEFVNALVERTDWQPDRVGLFAGAVAYTRYGPLTRHLFKLVASLTTGDTDTSREYEYTDWNEVEAFAVEFATFVEEGTEALERKRSGRPNTPTGPTGQRWAALLTLAAVGIPLLAYHRFVRPWYLDWGATDEEVERRLPGDDLVSAASSETTRAVTIGAPSDEVWPWIVQLGQGRGGFYSYSWLENLIGADIHNVDRIVPELQRLEEGDSIRMVTEDYWVQSPITSMTVEYIDPGRTLVLRGYDGGTWTFHLDPVDATTTRFVVRGRTPSNQALLARVVRYVAYELPHFVMERGMLLGIKARAERAGHVDVSAE